MRIVQLANLVTARSGGVRTALDHLGRGYTEAGHERHLVVPATDAAPRPLPGDGEHHLPAVRVPGSGGYRVLADRVRVRATLEQLRPDVVEVSDRWTLTWVGRWARAHGVRSVAMVHDHRGDTIASWPGVPSSVARRLAAAGDRSLPATFDAVVCASTHSAAPFGGSAQVVPLGVDLDTFRPDDAGPVRAGLHVVTVGRLSPEKRVDLAIATVAHLHARGVAVHLDVVGDGPLRARLERAAAGLPVRFHGYVADRRDLAALIGAADVALCPCPIEAFGLAALEALACGTPVVGTGGGVADLVGRCDPAAGRIAGPDGAAIAAAVLAVTAHPVDRRRERARAVAEEHPWQRAVDGMLAVLTGRTVPAVAA